MSKQGKNKKATPHSLEAVAWRELGIKLDKEHQKAGWGGELSPSMIKYAATDAQVLLPLAEIFESKLKDAGLERVWEIEHRALPAVLWMQNAGLPFDVEGWEQHLRQVQEERDQLRARLDSSVPGRPDGEKWNWNSHEQVKQV